MSNPATGESIQYEAPPLLSGQAAWSALTGPAGRALAALLLVLLLGVIFNAEGAFFQTGTHRDTLRQSSVYGILACGMTLVIISGGIDLAVGSVLALVAVTFSLFTIHWGWSAWTAVPVSLLLGGTMGLASGTVTARFGVQPFIATLAMMVFARGLAKYFSASDGGRISRAVRQPGGGIEFVDTPGIFLQIDRTVLGGHISVVTLIFLGCLAICWLLLSRHRWGRHLYAIGGNEEAARLSGVPVVWSKAAAYGMSGILAAVAGICQAAQDRQGDSNAGEGYELIAIAMVVIGGTNLMGGRGGIGLTLLGVLTIGYLDKILSINAVGLSGRLMLMGVIIIAAVLAQRRRGT